MFKYIKYTKVKTATTVLEFRGGDDIVKVNHFDVDAVSVESAVEADIDALIAQQPVEIGCTVITQLEFKDFVSASSQLRRIRDVVSSEIAKKYTIADEIAMSKRAVDDVKRVNYDTYVQECLVVGSGLKASIGY